MIEATFFFDLLRVLSYSVASIGLIFFAIDDYSRDRTTWIVWASMALQEVMVLALLSLDLTAAVAWMEARYLLTPFAVISAIAIDYNLITRYNEDNHAKRTADPAR